MASFLCFTITFFLVFLIISHRSSGQHHTYRYSFCPNTTTFTRNSTYLVNLRTLLSSLSSPNASYAVGYQSATAGRVPDMVTGYFLCRGDLSLESCRDCVVFAANDTLARCPEEKEAAIWYDECMLIYSNRNILYSVEMKPGAIMWNEQTVTGNQLDRLNKVLFPTMNETVAEAVNNSRKFATKKTFFTSSQMFYGLVQCTPDLTRQECGSCLNKCVNQLPRQNNGGRLLYPRCNSRFELYPFYNETAVETPPAPSVPSTLVPPQPPPNRKTISTRTIVAIVVPVVIVILVPLALGFTVCWRRKQYKDIENEREADSSSSKFDYGVVLAATNDFSEENKLGEGGFGSVYRGKLADGQEVAVKRLSKNAGQGEQEFKNEVLLLSRLRHKNLVKLLGYCLKGEEKLLIYEFLPNSSLDHLIFDSTKRSMTTWNIRYSIIGCIARGLLYLHEDSRLKIIHRDLKPNNILLEEDMNAKISDFGLAKLFTIDESQAKTNTVMGTRGYIAPEYVRRGQFSAKSDVYSFGITVLEIISGQKSNSFQPNGLQCYAWTRWREGQEQDIIDPLMENGSRSEIMRCIHIGLLCAQENVARRPTMNSVILWLSSSSVSLPAPTTPGFFTHNTSEPFQSESSSSNKWRGENGQVSVDEASITELEAR